MIDEIDAIQLNDKLNKKKVLLLIDCREQEEWEDGHIAQARLAPLSDFENQVQKLESEKAIIPEKLIVIHCRSGKRSMRACQFLANRGHTHLANLEGGLLGWQESGFPIQRKSSDHS